MLIAALALAALGALVHVYIWWLESFAWTTPAARKVFGTTPEEAETTRFLAFNQGFYNLFLAVLVAAGILAYAVGSPLVGRTLVLAGAGSMLAAAALLGATSPAHRGAALKQGGAPLLAVVLLLAA